MIEKQSGLSVMRALSHQTPAVRHQKSKQLERRRSHLQVHIRNVPPQEAPRWICR